MERVYTATQRAFSEVPHVAVALKNIDSTQRHIGVLHRNADNDEVLLLHLAWHMKLQNGYPQPEYVWVDPPIPPARARQVAAVCRKIWRGNERGQVPFGFSAPNDCFDEATCEFLLGPTKYGLTCATFVVAVFHLARLVLLDPSTWPRRADDAKWQKQIVDLLRQRGASGDHLKHVESEVGSPRIRPEEVGGAAALNPWPVSFINAARIGKQIVEFLNSPQDRQ